MLLARQIVFKILEVSYFDSSKNVYFKKCFNLRNGCQFELRSNSLFYVLVRSYVSMFFCHYVNRQKPVIFLGLTTLKTRNLLSPVLNPYHTGTFKIPIPLGIHSGWEQFLYWWEPIPLLKHVKGTYFNNMRLLGLKRIRDSLKRRVPHYEISHP